MLEFLPALMVSIHAPLARSNSTIGRTGRIWRSFNTCSSCEEQHRRDGQGHCEHCFNTCSSCEEQLEALITTGVTAPFQYMLLLRGATSLCFARRDAGSLFQYMLLLRGATTAVCTTTIAQTFQYMLLLRGATDAGLNEIIAALFQYMLLLRGATGVI